MKMNKKIFSTLFLIVLFAINSFGQEVSFDAKAPETVSVGQQFRLIFTVNAEGDKFKAPSKIDGFDIIYGPSTSSSYSSSVMGGKTVTAMSISYVYVLQPKKEGTFVIPEATIEVKGKTISSNTVKIKVVAGEKPQEPESNDSNESRVDEQSSDITEKDAFIQTLVSKTQVKENEAFAITYKLYTKVGVQGVERTQYPKYEGFQVDELNVANNQMKTETYNGQKYSTAIIRQLLLTPQQKGNLEIPEAKIGLVFQIPTGVQTIFGEEMRTFTKYFTTKSSKVQVIALPSPKPENYVNVAGSFSMSSSISTTHANVDSPVLIRVVISGNGNTSRIPTPKIVLPSEFESNRPQVSQSVDVTNDGLYGTKTIEYLFVPREDGDYKIPSVSISYFDIETKTYKTLSTPEYNLKVDKEKTKNSKEVFV